MRLWYIRCEVDLELLYSPCRCDGHQRLGPFDHLTTDAPAPQSALGSLKRHFPPALQSVDPVNEQHRMVQDLERFTFRASESLSDIVNLSWRSAVNRDSVSRFSAILDRLNIQNLELYALTIAHCS